MLTLKYPTSRMFMAIILMVLFSFRPIVVVKDKNTHQMLIYS